MVPMLAFTISLNVFVWKSRTDQCEIYSLLYVVVWSPRHFQARLTGGGQGLRVCFLFFFTAMLSGWSGCWESSVQAAKPAVTQQGIDWIISVSSDSNVAYTGLLLRATQLLLLPGKSARICLLMNDLDFFKAYFLKLALNLPCVSITHAGRLPLSSAHLLII